MSFTSHPHREAGTRCTAFGAQPLEHCTLGHSNRGTQALGALTFWGSAIGAPSLCSIFAEDRGLILIMTNQSGHQRDKIKNYYPLSGDRKHIAMPGLATYQRRKVERYVFWNHLFAWTANQCFLINTAVKKNNQMVSTF